MVTFVFSAHEVPSLASLWIKISWGSADLAILVYNEIKVAVMVSPQAETKPYTTTHSLLHCVDGGENWKGENKKNLWVEIKTVH